MAALDKRINAFVKLGDFLREHSNSTASNSNSKAVDRESEWHSKFDEAIVIAGHKNGWFTKEQVKFAINNWAEQLTEPKLTKWLKPYPLQQNNHKTVAIIMAGNIPLVGFHDFIAVIISGNRVLAKCSSNDTILLPFIANYLTHIEPDLSSEINFTEGRLTDFEVVIATGSNNTARYFDYYFGNKPNIIRKNRNSVAVLNGMETEDQLAALGEDIFRYYGLGCRNVSKLYVPENYSFDSFFKSIEPYQSLSEQNKYSNNYDYNKAVYLMSEFLFLDNGFFLLKEDERYASPIGTAFYETYASEEDLKKRLLQDADMIQCIVGGDMIENSLPFGKTQKPELWDYADGIDTVEFLLKT
ncbi:acyl-CoA reductase [uncultured Eudoraea sp.]|uniref:acyl-CoA reductase n=1 Tax=uncultured Eudoraea sp. TaxID=1035614 RepID=UPI002634862F|nr:acyl-CoA reductase [uncultured Eudoraea sp.]